MAVNRLHYHKNFFTFDEQSVYLDILEKLKFPPRDALLSMRGNPVNRRELFWCDVGIDGSIPVYRSPYSGPPPISIPYPSELIPLVDKVKKFATQNGDDINKCICILYEHGKDFITWHFDKIDDAVQGASIYGVSFGAERTFMLQNMKTGVVDELMLESGSLYQIDWETNLSHVHAIKESKSIIGPRWSLTFRCVASKLYPDGHVVDRDNIRYKTLEEFGNSRNPEKGGKYFSTPQAWFYWNTNFNPMKKKRKNIEDNNDRDNNSKTDNNNKNNNNTDNNIDNKDNKKHIKLASHQQSITKWFSKT
jgi:alkylated DNA repair dioxygenase AlkB